MGQILARPLCLPPDLLPSSILQHPPTINPPLSTSSKTSPKSPRIVLRPLHHVSVDLLVFWSALGLCVCLFCSTLGPSNCETSPFPFQTSQNSSKHQSYYCAALNHVSGSCASFQSLIASTDSSETTLSGVVFPPEYLSRWYLQNQHLLLMFQGLISIKGALQKETRSICLSATLHIRGIRGKFCPSRCDTPVLIHAPRFGQSKTQMKSSQVMKSICVGKLCK